MIAKGMNSTLLKYHKENYQVLQAIKKPWEHVDIRKVYDKGTRATKDLVYKVLKHVMNVKLNVGNIGEKEQYYLNFIKGKKDEMTFQLIAKLLIVRYDMEIDDRFTDRVKNLEKKLNTLYYYINDTYVKALMDTIVLHIAQPDATIKSIRTRISSTNTTENKVLNDIMDNVFGDFTMNRLITEVGINQYVQKIINKDTQATQYAITMFKKYIFDKKLEFVYEENVTKRDIGVLMDIKQEIGAIPFHLPRHMFILKDVSEKLLSSP